VGLNGRPKHVLYKKQGVLRAKPYFSPA